MKLKRTLLASAILMVVALGCSDDDGHQPSLKDLSPYAQQFVGMRLSSSNAMRQTSDGAINQSFQTAMNDMRAFPGGRIKGDSANGGGGTEPSDSTIYIDPWVSCATITTTTNDDGSITTVYDYGEGCEEGWSTYKYLMHGKYTQTYKWITEVNGSVYTYSYLFDIVYDNYGGQYVYADTTEWFTDGHSYYDGYSTYDTTDQKFSGSYVFNDTTEYGYGGVVNRYKSKGKSKYNESGSTVAENEYEYGDGVNYYHSKVTKPLISDYNCNRNGVVTIRAIYIWIPISGHEVITYKQDGKEGTFEIDYGDGECDNILYIIENGERVKVDMGDVMPWCGTMEG